MSWNFLDARARAGLTSVLALAVTLYGLANVMPSIGSFRLGPFPMVFFRSTFFALCFLVVVLGLKGAGGRQLPKWVDAVAWLSVVAMLYACKAFYDVSIAIDEAMFLFGPKDMWTALAACAGALFLCWRLWGAPVALLGVLGIVYMATGPYWPGPLQTIGGDVNELLAQNLWFSLDSGILGSTFSIVVTTVFPFIVLGAVLEGAGAGESMIRIAFALMKRTAGGPAHAAVLASGLFGTVSGSAVANVVGTGVITIPMIKKRGFSANFAGAVEAAASTGGQIMPPIMGAAALVMADYVGVSYLTVVIAVLVPAIAYYGSLFMMILFESRRLGIKADASSAGVAPPERQDYLNMLLVFGPLVMIVVLLVGGMSASGASIAAIALLFPMSFINPAVRRSPMKLVTALRNGGETFAQLLTAIAAVSIVISTLSATGVPVKFGVLMVSALEHSLFVALLVVAGGCILLGMGMPTLPAYVTVAAIALPSMQALGLEPLTAHMFVFMIAVASTITPPVAIAAYAAASISGGRPIGTAVQASRIGIMIFIIPFAFVYNPLILTVPQAGAAFAWGPYLLLLVKLAVAIYVMASALIRFDKRALGWPEVVARLAASVLLFAPGGHTDMVGAALTAALLGLHHWKNRTAAAVPSA
ncbi:TRAP transporter [Hydrogenophaga crassostreae]|uniref:TRAP transporter n=1 Tax=Hydrogenophaga crassostreae TaxID=1763535 RepID=A0A167J1F8_9BURK|nr:TRAP transporter fused permease subunit [Hydrogenophaga crassostreae]AOW13769.1 TRAP transporter [Hydrogenophaga crassostreae]OAD44268.1 TRAP transporter [Hydrogenophaga crassostreae]